jgi:hypothetical protein
LAFFTAVGLGEQASAVVSNCCLIPCTPPMTGPGHWGYWGKGSCLIFQDPDTCYLTPGGCALP